MKGLNNNMVKTQFGGSGVVIKISSNELGSYDENTPIFIPRSTVSYEIVKLQNITIKTDLNDKKLLLLINAISDATKDSIHKRHFVRMNAKSVLECFKDEAVPVYVND